MNEKLRTFQGGVLARMIREQNSNFQKENIDFKIIESANIDQLYIVLQLIYANFLHLQNYKVQILINKGGKTNYMHEPL